MVHAKWDESPRDILLPVIIIVYFETFLLRPSNLRRAVHSNCDGPTRVLVFQLEGGGQGRFRVDEAGTDRRRFTERTRVCATCREI